MLRKLLKYEIKATSRIFLPMYALLIILAFINKFFFSVNVEYFNIPQIITMTAFVAIIVGIFVMTLVVTIQRFNKNLLTDEGYLSFTLPVKASSHINCKMITTLLWVVLSGITSFISILILGINDRTIDEFKEFCFDLSALFNKIGIDAYVITFEIIVLLVIGLLGEILSIYASITIGNMSSKHKLLAGIGAYLGFGLIEQLVISVIFTSYGSNITKFLDDLNNLPLMSKFQNFELGILLVIIFSLIFGSAYYFITNWMLKNKLNLE